MKKTKLDRTGLEIMYAHLGKQVTLKQLDELNDISPILMEALVSTFAVFYNPKTCVLDQKTKELCVVSMLTLQGSSLPELETHVHAALRVGASIAEITEAIVQVVPYGGFPCVLNALSILVALQEHKPT